MKSYLGSIRSSSHTTRGEATVLIFDRTIDIGWLDEAGAAHTITWNIPETNASFETSSQSTVLRNAAFPGTEVRIPGNDAIEFTRQMQELLARPWHQTGRAREWGRNVLILLGVLTGLVILYLLIVPWLSEKMASTVSVKTEEQLGEAVYGALGLEQMTNDSATLLLNEYFESMQVRSAYDVRITAVNSETVNAFALPGGRIIVYTALLQSMEHYSELAALLSHEFMHVDRKHSTKAICRRLGSKVFISLLLGNFGTVTTILVDHADNLKSLKYSRRLEKEADLEGLQLLKTRKIDPKGFSALFRHLGEAARGSSQPELLASHPDLDKRISYINAASDGAVIEEHENLKTIFEKIKLLIK